AGAPMRRPSWLSTSTAATPRQGASAHTAHFSVVAVVPLERAIHHSPPMRAARSSRPSPLRSPIRTSCQATFDQAANSDVGPPAPAAPAPETLNHHCPPNRATRSSSPSPLTSPARASCQLANAQRTRSAVLNTLPVEVPTYHSPESSPKTSVWPSSLTSMMPTCQGAFAHRAHNCAGSKAVAPFERPTHHSPA